MEALTRDSRRLSTTSMNTKRTFLLCRKADISTWGLQNIHKTCSAKVVMSGFSKVKVSAFAEAELFSGVDQFES